MRTGLRLGYVVLAAAVAVFTSVAARASTVVTWNYSSAHIIDGNALSSAFDIAELYFPAVTANSLTSISGPGYYQNRSTPDRVFSMSVLLDGTWTEIYTSGRVPGGVSVTVLLSSLDTPMLFQPGVITGLKLTTKGDVNYAYQKMNGTQFTFDFISTPLPAALPLFGSGLAVIGFLRWRRRLLRAATPSR
jgi:hypothetical protein